MNRQFAPQVETQRVPPVGLQPAMHLAVHALRAVLERPEDFLAAFFSPEGELPCSTSNSTCPPSMPLNSRQRTQLMISGVVSRAGLISLVPLRRLVSTVPVTPRFPFAPIAPSTFMEAALLAIDSHLSGVGEWGCAVTPPLCAMGGISALLLEQAS